MIHDPDLSTRERSRRRRRRRAADRPLGPDGIALCVLATFVVDLALVEIIGRLTGHPGVALLLGWAR